MPSTNTPLLDETRQCLGIFGRALLDTRFTTGRESGCRERGVIHFPKETFTISYNKQGLVLAKASYKQLQGVVT